MFMLLRRSTINVMLLDAEYIISRGDGGYVHRVGISMIVSGIETGAVPSLHTLLYYTV